MAQGLCPKKMPKTWIASDSYLQTALTSGAGLDMAESAQKCLRRWIMFAVNDPKWEIQATNLETGEVLQSESLKLSA